MVSISFSCEESHTRISVEDFRDGKAVWSNGRPYLKLVADRLGLPIDAEPPYVFWGIFNHRQSTSPPHLPQTRIESKLPATEIIQHVVEPPKDAPEIDVYLEGEKWNYEVMKDLKMWKGLSEPEKKRAYAGTIVRRFKKDDIVFSEGEYGSTAYYIFSGSADIYIESQLRALKKMSMESAKGGKGLFARLGDRLKGKTNDPQAPRFQQQFITVDAEIDLPIDNPVAKLKEGALFGVMSCINYYPRSTTVRANEDCVMLVMLRSVIDIIKKSNTSEFRQELENIYRKRSLLNHLRNALKEEVDQKIIEQVFEQGASLKDYEKGEVIFKEGDTADAFYLIRCGFVRVSKRYMLSRNELEQMNITTKEAEEEKEQEREREKSRPKRRSRRMRKRRRTRNRRKAKRRRSTAKRL